MTEGSLEGIARLYGAYYDHYEAQYNSTTLDHKEQKTYREINRRKFIKYALSNGLDFECHLKMVPLANLYRGGE